MFSAVHAGDRGARALWVKPRRACSDEQADPWGCQGVCVSCGNEQGQERCLYGATIAPIFVPIRLPPTGIGVF